MGGNSHLHASKRSAAGFFYLRESSSGGLSPAGCCISTTKAPIRNPTVQAFTGICAGHRLASRLVASTPSLQNAQLHSGSKLGAMYSALFPCRPYSEKQGNRLHIRTKPKPMEKKKRSQPVASRKLPIRALHPNNLIGRARPGRNK